MGPWILLKLFATLSTHSSMIFLLRLSCRENNPPKLINGILMKSSKLIYWEKGVYLATLRVR